MRLLALKEARMQIVNDAVKQLKRIKKDYPVAKREITILDGDNTVVLNELVFVYGKEFIRLAYLFPFDEQYVIKKLDKIVSDEVRKIKKICGNRMPKIESVDLKLSKNMKLIGGIKSTDGRYFTMTENLRCSNTDLILTHYSYMLKDSKFI